MYENPICPNCSRPMKQERTLPGDKWNPESNVFKCDYCGVSFLTEDHIPIAGTRV